MESELHGLLKQAARCELEKEGYDLYLEPSESPVNVLSWTHYRPDVLGLTCQETEFELAIIECETNPTVRRLIEKRLKIRRQICFQKRLDQKNLFRLLLVIPPGTLRKVNTCSVRKLWEIWIVDNKGNIAYKIPKTAGSQDVTQKPCKFHN
jgi:hypothetical protein